MQTTSQILMIRPVAFGLNIQTADSNAFQNKSAPQEKVQEKALAEFDAFADKLRAKGIEVTVIEDTLKPRTPDSIFPNNWISFHEDGSIYLYPMQAENRRLERRDDLIDTLSKTFDIREINDISFTEDRGEYLEGTGSMVLDRENKIAYACLSIRTQQNVLDIFCNESGYQTLTFDAVDQNGFAIYHTNVMMCVADKFVVICLDAVPNEEEKNKLISCFKKTVKEIIEIDYSQMNQFAGNMLQVNNKDGKSFLVMSERAHHALNENQIEKISKYAAILSSPLTTIEDNGGGSARCMMAEIHLDKL
ncbi:amidinotransferase [Pedobacter psychrophilus]|uniref:Amidinotransferase n=1 Tax=Pedobacter psychrophilus TaxID=1826909 RepID=A0A179DNK5_9SPHI|nr:arginine deiminase-related protein [Pedobacter psychrophilus]OAQ42139.1 amidinotransferase [Pedobacter psychrophilus]